MTLIAILLGLAVEQVQGSLQERRTYAAFLRWATRLRRGFRAWPLDGPLGVVIVLAPPAFVTGVAHYVLLRLFWPLALAFDVAVLIYCLGPRNLSNQVALFLDAHQRGDQDAASQIAAQIHPGGTATGARTLARQVTEGILVQANRRVLGVLIWFTLLGPLGAVLYRLTERLAYSAEGPDGKDVGEGMGFPGAAIRLYGMLDWPPARLVTLGYALAGNFHGAMEAVHARESDWWGLKPANNESVLVAGGLGALELPALGHASLAERADIEPALALVKRTLVLGLIMVALVTIGYWAG